ncbi:MAG TPA: ABC transporter permease, partial [Bryobacteraceae bacterium]|nr:ABC transporter permease [Bryobacteraceae bacterium]
MRDASDRDWLRYAAGRLPNAGPEVQAELAQHLEQAYADALADGQSEPDAAAWAESRFADWRRLEADIADSKRRAHPLAGGGGDLRQALRLFRFHPGLAALAVATLAFGIGGNTAIFTLADTLSLRGLPYPNSDRLMSIETSWPRQREIEPWTSALDFFDLRSRAKSFDGIAGISPVWNDVLTGAGPAERLETLYVSPSFFSMLGVHPRLGRTLEAGDDVGLGGKRVAVLSNWFWSIRFGARPDIVGQSITLNGAPFTVVGILPRDFHYLGSPLAGKTAEISV